MSAEQCEEGGMLLKNKHSVTAVALLMGVLGAQSATGRTPAPTKLPSFDVASVKPNRSNNPPNSNFPLGPGDVYVPNGGLFSATNFPLVTYIFFAYKVIGNQGQSLLPQLPGWATAEHFDIQARAEGNPGKDQMRLLMRSLLADRFKLATHYETKEVPVLAFVLARPGKTGPQLQAHADGAPCPTDAPPPGSAQPQPQLAPPPGKLSELCNGILGMPPSVSGRVRLRARNVTIGFIADSLSLGTNLGRTMVDRTGLSGTVDFTLEWTPEAHGPVQPGGEVQPESTGPTFEDALREQLGINLKSTAFRAN
jgi:uncharacterized protein (TIGR03435 family)